MPGGKDGGQEAVAGSRYWPRPPSLATTPSRLQSLFLHAHWQARGAAAHPRGFLPRPPDIPGDASLAPPAPLPLATGYWFQSDPQCEDGKFFPGGSGGKFCSFFHLIYRRRGGRQPRVHGRIYCSSVRRREFVCSSCVGCSTGERCGCPNLF